MALTAINADGALTGSTPVTAYTVVGNAVIYAVLYNLDTDQRTITLRRNGTAVAKVDVAPGQFTVVGAERLTGTVGDVFELEADATATTTEPQFTVHGLDIS